MRVPHGGGSFMFLVVITHLTYHQLAREQGRSCLIKEIQEIHLKRILMKLKKLLLVSAEQVGIS